MNVPLMHIYTSLYRNEVQIYQILKEKRKKKTHCRKQQQADIVRETEGEKIERTYTQCYSLATFFFFCRLK